MDVSALFSPTMFDDPYPTYAQLREQAPALHVPQLGMWLFSRYDDVLRILRNAEVFSSAQLPDASIVQDPRLLEGVELLIGTSSVVSSDPPVHTRLRRLVSVAFTPRVVARLEGRIRELARELIDAVAREESFDLMAALAVPLPVIVIAELLGVDPARRGEFKRWSDDLLVGSGVDVRIDDAEIRRIVASRHEFAAFLREMIELRRREPREDLLSDLVRAESEHDVLTPEEVLTMASVLMIAGNETTTNLIGNAMAEILRHPAELRRLRDDPSLIPGFLEEALRYRSPVPMLTRTTTREVTLAGVTLPAGARIAGLVDSANHDPAQFPDPERFDITRNPAHLSFGHGIHFCIGAPLSRLEGRIVFEELLRRLPELSREPGPLDWNPTFYLRGLKTLRLQQRAALH